MTKYRVEHPAIDESVQPNLIKLAWALRFYRQNPKLLRRMEKRLEARLLPTLEALPSAPALAVPRVHWKDFDYDDFMADNGFRGPIVIEGLFADSYALKHWSLDHLKRVFGKSRVQVHLKPVKGSAFHDGEATCHYLADHIDNIRQGRLNYMVSCTQLFVDHPEIRDQLSIERIEKFLQARVVRTEMFVGGSLHSSAFHAAVGTNLFAQIVGRKRWILVPPEYAWFLYPDIGRSRSTIYFGSPINSETYQCAQRERFPLYAYAPKFEVVTKPGDLLINPSWMWHEVSNLEESVGVPLRSVFRHYATNPIRTFLESHQKHFTLMQYLSPMGLKIVKPTIQNALSKGPGIHPNVTSGNGPRQWRVKCE